METLSNTAEKHECKPCKQTFTTKKSLARHLREVQPHRDGNSAHQMLMCDVCSGTFTRAYDLQRHRHEQHVGGGARRGPPRRQDLRPSAQPGEPVRIRDACTIPALDSKPPAARQVQGVAPGNQLSAHGKRGDTARCRQMDSPVTQWANGSRRALSGDIGVLSRSFPCGLCRESFPPNQADALARHLNKHFEELQNSHTCDKCQISFRHQEDLQKHLASAKTGDCGFMFKHTTPCTGHHPPPDRASSAGRNAKRRCTYDMNDEDRFNFCFRIRTWELAQHQAFRRTVDVISIHTCLRSLSVNSSSDKATTTIRLARSETAKHYRHRSVSVSDSDQMQQAEQDLDTALLRAVCSGDCKMAAAYLAAGADIDAEHHLGRRPLHYAINFGFHDMAKLLWTNKASLSLEDHNRKSPLEVTAGGWTRNAMQAALADMDTAALAGHLRVAAQSGKSLVKSILINALALKFDVAATSLRKLLDAEDLNALISVLANPHDQSDYDRALCAADLLSAYYAGSLRSENVAIFYAARCRDLDLLSLLLAGGTDANSRDGSENEILPFVITRNTTETHTCTLQMVELLLRHGANPDPAIFTAVERGEPEILSSLLAWRSAARHVHLSLGRDPLLGEALSRVVYSDHADAQTRSCASDIIQLLLDRGACLDLALLAAIKHQSPEKLSLLLSRGSEVTDGILSFALNNDRPFRENYHTAHRIVEILLDHRAQKCRSRPSLKLNNTRSLALLDITLLKRLLNHGLSVTCDSDCGFSILLNATIEDNGEVVRELLRRGVDVEHSAMKQSPLRAAIANGNVALLDLLLSKRAIKLSSESCLLNWVEEYRLKTSFSSLIRGPSGFGVNRESAADAMKGVVRKYCAQRSISIKK